MGLASVSSRVRPHSRRSLEVEETCSAEGCWGLGWFSFFLPLQGCLEVLRSKYTLQFMFKEGGSLGRPTSGVAFMEMGNHRSSQPGQGICGYATCSVLSLGPVTAQMRRGPFSIHASGRGDRATFPLATSPHWPSDSRSSWPWSWMWGSLARGGTCELNAEQDLLHLVAVLVPVAISKNYKRALSRMREGKRSHGV